MPTPWSTKPTAPSGRWIVALVGTLLPVLLLTLVPGTEPPEGAGPPMDVLCLICGSRGTADLLLNMLLFVPLGWVLGMRMGAGWVLLAGLLLSGAIEAVQIALPGRYPTLGDVVWNGSGALVGATVPGWAVRRGWPLAAVGVLGLLAPLLLAPAPPEGVYYGQWTARFGHMEAYEGRVLEARVGGIAMISGPSDRSGELRALLSQGGPVEVRFVAGPAPPAPAPIFSIYDHRQRELLMMAADGADLVVRRWTAARSLRLDQPGLRWPGALAGVEAGDTIEARLFHGPRTSCLATRGFASGGREVCDVVPGLGGGWTLLLSPGTPSPGIVRRVGVLWALGMGALFAFLPAAPVAFIVATLAVVSAAAGAAAALPYLTFWWAEVVAFVVGAGAIFMFKRMSERFTDG